MSNSALKLNPPPTPPELRVNSQARGSVLEGPLAMLLIGGGSMILLALMSVSLKPESPVASIGWWVFSLSFIVNFPHFLVSYQMLYVDFGARLLKERRLVWAGIVVPVILVGILTTAFISQSATLLGYMAASMYFFVGWHYVKQIFGGITVSNAMTGFSFNATERNVLKANLFSLWAISFLIPNIGEHNYIQDGILYGALNLPAWPLDGAYLILGVSGVGVLALTVLKYIREGQWPSPTAVVCFLTIYAWYLPALGHPMFMHLVPFFHSLQYLIFVYLFRRNKVAASIEQAATPLARRRQVVGLYGYLAVPFITGAFFMYILPRALDQLHLADAQIFGPTPAYFCFIIFINVHHYFIDNVLWRGTNPDMKKYLFRRAG